MNRIDRLTAILIQLQSKRIVKTEELPSRFEISLRTVYRDVKAWMEAGVPICSEAGKGAKVTSFVINNEFIYVEPSRRNYYTFLHSFPKS